jgi:hypothetical protein
VRVRWRRRKVDPYGCSFCQDENNRNYGHLDYVAQEDESGIHLLRCPRCDALYEDNSHDEPTPVDETAASLRWGYERS